MIQIAADLNNGYLINADDEQMRAIREGIDYALEHGEWTTQCLGADGVVPMLIRVSDTPV